jgi:hypothetical protein
MSPCCPPQRAAQAAESSYRPPLTAAIMKLLPHRALRLERDNSSRQLESRTPFRPHFSADVGHGIEDRSFNPFYNLKQRGSALGSVANSFSPFSLLPVIIWRLLGNLFETLFGPVPLNVWLPLPALRTFSLASSHPQNAAVHSRLASQASPLNRRRAPNSIVANPAVLHLFKNNDTGERFDVQAGGYFYLTGHIVHEAGAPPGRRQSSSSKTAGR